MLPYPDQSSSSAYPYPYNATSTTNKTEVKQEQVVPSSSAAIKSEVVKDELFDTDNEEDEGEQQQQQQQQQLPNEKEYTTSLHWKNPSSTSISKRPFRK